MLNLTAFDPEEIDNFNTIDNTILAELIYNTEQNSNHNNINNNNQQQAVTTMQQMPFMKSNPIPNTKSETQEN